MFAKPNQMVWVIVDNSKKAGVNSRLEVLPKRFVKTQTLVVYDKTETI